MKAFRCEVCFADPPNASGWQKTKLLSCVEQSCRVHRPHCEGSVWTWICSFPYPKSAQNEKAHKPKSKPPWLAIITANCWWSPQRRGLRGTQVMMPQRWCFFLGFYDHFEVSKRHLCHAAKVEIHRKCFHPSNTRGLGHGSPGKKHP